MVRVHLADCQRHPVRCRDELSQCGRELGESQPAISPAFLGDRQVQVVEDVDVEMDEETLESPCPAIDQTTRR